MAVYMVTGKLGAGKTLAAVGRAQEYLQAGCRVATNLELWPENLAGRTSGADQAVIRVPDKPRVEDLEAIGLGYEGPMDESRNGALILDELGTWLNSRSWNDKERAGVLDWFLHARKRRWDVYLIVQDISVVDKQLRDTLCEHLVVCRRMDRFPIPVVGKLLRGRLPRIHVGTVHYGDNETAPKVDRWWYRGSELFGGYDTEQVFAPDQEWSEARQEMVDYRAPYSVLPAATLRAWYRAIRQVQVDPDRIPCALGTWCLYFPLGLCLAALALVVRWDGARGAPAQRASQVLAAAALGPWVYWQAVTIRETVPAGPDPELAPRGPGLMLSSEGEGEG